jgi:hypothetical protein
MPPQSLTRNGELQVPLLLGYLVFQTCFSLLQERGNGTMRGADGSWFAIPGCAECGSTPALSWQDSQVGRVARAPCSAPEVFIKDFQVGKGGELRAGIPDLTVVVLDGQLFLATHALTM